MSLHTNQYITWLIFHATFYFFIITIVLCVVMMNVLIVVIGESFSESKAILQGIDNIVKIQNILEFFNAKVRIIIKSVNDGFLVIFSVKFCTLLWYFSLNRIVWNINFVIIFLSRLKFFLTLMNYFNLKQIAILKNNCSYLYLQVISFDFHGKNIDYLLLLLLVIVMLIHSTCMQTLVAR